MFPEISQPRPNQKIHWNGTEENVNAVSKLVETQRGHRNTPALICKQKNSPTVNILVKIDSFVIQKGYESSEAIPDKQDNRCPSLNLVTSPREYQTDFNVFQVVPSQFSRIREADDLRSVLLDRHKSKARGFQ